MDKLLRSVHLTLDQLGSDVSLRECPFCGEYELELCNTWTPLYWIECNHCGVEMHGVGAEWTTRADANDLEKHRRAALSAVTAWNTRNGVPPGAATP